MCPTCPWRILNLRINWELYRDQYCMFRNEAFNSSEVFMGEKLGYCHRRLNEERAEDLERMLVK